MEKNMEHEMDTGVIEWLREWLVGIVAGRGLDNHQGQFEI